MSIVLEKLVFVLIGAAAGVALYYYRKRKESKDGNGKDRK